jgi:DNA-binding PadR family transcriptional regulator
MDRSLGRLWPRATSKVYEEPKKLARLGLAKTRTKMTGRRASTVYSITPAGRRALRTWLASPATGRPVLEFEALTKVFFGENGTKQDILATLAAVRSWSLADRAEHIAIATAYARGSGMFPERAAQVALTGRFIFEFSEMVGRWADWATGVVEQWPDDPRQAEPDRSVFEDVARLAKEPVVSTATGRSRRQTR